MFPTSSKICLFVQEDDNNRVAIITELLGYKNYTSALQIGHLFLQFYFGPTKKAIIMDLNQITLYDCSLLRWMRRLPGVTLNTQL